VDQGARVTAIDLTTEFVSLTTARVGERARVLQADLTLPLEFADDTFDIVVSPLVLHYLKDWLPTLREFHRVLRPGGVLVFSTHHPFMDWKLFDTDDYFAVELLHDEWDIGKVDYYRRPLTAISRDLEASGFCIERLLEPQPTEEFRRRNPETHERLMRNPWFLAVRARGSA
jgi:SAM-dependent methyltransferase